MWAALLLFSPVLAGFRGLSPLLVAGFADFRRISPVLAGFRRFSTPVVIAQIDASIAQFDAQIDCKSIAQIDASLIAQIDASIAQIDARID